MPSSQILTSIFGRRLGLTVDGYLTGQGFKGIRTGTDGANFAVGDLSTAVTLSDDFDGPTMSSKWTSHKGSDGGCVDWAVVAAVNGTVAATMGSGAGATMAVNGVQLDNALNWRASDGGLVMEASIKVPALTTSVFFVGFTNQVASLQMPFTISGGALTANAADACGFLFDTAATAATTKLVGAKASVSPAVQDTGVAAFSTSAFVKFRVEIDANENALFYIGGVPVGVAMALALTKTVALTPVIAAFRRAASGGVVTLDYIRVQKSVAR